MLVSQNISTTNIKDFNYAPNKTKPVYSQHNYIHIACSHTTATPSSQNLGEQFRFFSMIS